jgi:hypothetical protein
MNEDVTLKDFLYLLVMFGPGSGEDINITLQCLKILKIQNDHPGLF